jgi:hypothetical protein
MQRSRYTRDAYVCLILSTGLAWSWIALVGCAGQDTQSAVITLVAPVEGRAMDLKPDLRVKFTGTDFRSDWYFEVDTDSLFSDPLRSDAVSAYDGKVHWRVSADLEVSVRYYWRVGASLGRRVIWEPHASFEGGPPLHLFPSPFCCNNAKKHNTLLVRGMVPPARLQVFNQHDLMIYETGRITGSQFAWPLKDQGGALVPNGRYRFEIADNTGNRTLKLRVSR